MSFFENLAAALDASGIESRVNDDTLFVPITSELEIQFVEIDPFLPAANVYIATANDLGEVDDFDAVLVSVVFSVEDAVAEVNNHIATDQVVTVLHDLLEGTDERIGDLEFNQLELSELGSESSVVAQVTEYSQVAVEIELIDGVPTAFVSFNACNPAVDEQLAAMLTDIAEMLRSGLIDEEQALALEEEMGGHIVASSVEILNLGSFTDFDQLFDVLSLVSDQAESWEEQLVPIEDEDEPDVYDLFGKDDDDDGFGFFEDEEDDQGLGG